MFIVLRAESWLSFRAVSFSFSDYEIYTPGPQSGAVGKLPQFLFSSDRREAWRLMCNQFCSYKPTIAVILLQLVLCHVMVRLIYNFKFYIGQNCYMGKWPDRNCLCKLIEKIYTNIKKDWSSHMVRQSVPVLDVGVNMQVKTKHQDEQGQMMGIDLAFTASPYRSLRTGSFQVYCRRIITAVLLLALPRNWVKPLWSDHWPGPPAAASFSFFSAVGQVGVVRCEVFWHWHGRIYIIEQQLERHIQDWIKS